LETLPLLAVEIMLNTASKCKEEALNCHCDMDTYTWASTPVFFFPFKLLLANSSLPKIAFLARVVVNNLKLATLRVFKNDAHLWKTFRCCSAFPLLTRLGRHKCSSGKRKRSPGRSVSEAAPRFGTYVCLNPAVLRKTLSASSEETFDSRKKPSNLW